MPLGFNESDTLKFSSILIYFVLEQDIYTLRKVAKTSIMEQHALKNENNLLNTTFTLT